MGALYEIAHIFYLGSVVFVLLYIIEGRAENQSGLTQNQALWIVQICNKNVHTIWTCGQKFQIPKCSAASEMYFPMLGLGGGGGGAALPQHLWVRPLYGSQPFILLYGLLTVVIPLYITFAGYLCKYWFLQESCSCPGISVFPYLWC